MSAKGIVDLVYHPNMHTNHFLKDDFLYISYKDKIEPVTDEERKIKEYRYSRYKGYDQLVCGSEIIDILPGAAKYLWLDEQQGQLGHRVCRFCGHGCHLLH